MYVYMIYVKRIWTWRNKVVRLTGINQVNFVFVREYLFLSEVVWLSHSKTQTGKQRLKTRMRSSTSTYTQTQALHEYSSTPSLHICRCILGRIALEAVLSTRIMWRHLHKDMEELESRKGWQLAFSTWFLHIAEVSIMQQHVGNLDEPLLYAWFLDVHKEDEILLAFSHMFHESSD